MKQLQMLCWNKFSQHCKDTKEFPRMVRYFRRTLYVYTGIEMLVSRYLQYLEVSIPSSWRW